jgi:PAS domain S-box-containing protein
MKTDRKILNALVIEDNMGDYVLLEEILAGQPDEFFLLHAQTFAEAKRTLLNEDYKFDVVLLDITLPDRAGAPLINEIVALSNNAPVIILTGNNDTNFSLRSLNMGISDYILKDDLTSTMLYKSIIYCIERTKSTLALIESERKYGDLFHLSPLPMWVTNLETMQFVDVNDATLLHYGYTREEFLSMTTKNISATGECSGTQTIDAAKGQHNTENNSQRLVTHVKKNGDLINVELQIAQITYKGVKSGIVIAKDVTERMDYIKAIERQNERLLEISWIQSHVVRAPLSRIIGLIPLIESAIEMAPDEETKRMLKYMAFSANELDEIIMDITEKTEIQENHNVAKMQNNVLLKRVS